MSASTLPAVATPWEDPFGNVWCVVPSSDVDRDEWVKVYRWTSTRWDHWHTTGTYNLHPALLAGLGHTLPEGPITPPAPPPKRVAKVVHFGGWELAVKRGLLYERNAGTPWRPSNNWTINRDFFTLVDEAFAGAGDVLPGEE